MYFVDLPYIVAGTKKFIINKKGVLEQDPNGETGLKFYTIIGENLDLKISLKK